MPLLTLPPPTSSQARIPASLFSGEGPNVSVEVAFRSTPLAESALWEDITEYVRGVTINRGRSKELDRFQPSTCTFTVDATAREFDPENAAGPWFGYILPNRKVRVRAQYPVNGVLTDFWLWEGFVDEWPVDYAGMSFAVVDVPCSDAFAMLANIGIADSAFAAELAQDIGGAEPPTSWYRITEESDATTAIDTLGANDAAYRNAPTVGGDPLAVNGAGSVDFTPADSNVRAPVGILTGFPFAIEFMFQGTWDDYFINGNVEGGFTGSSAGYMIVQAGAGSPARLIWRMFNASGYPWLLTANSAINDGAPHHVVVGAGADSRAFIYIDGVYSVDAALSSQQGAVPAWPTYTYWTFGSSEAGSSIGMDAVLDEVVIWDGVAPSAARIAARAEAALVGWAGDTTAERVTRILDSIGWPEDLRDIGTGSTIVSTAWTTGSALDAIMALVDTENGQCYVDGQGRIVFRGRDEVYSDARSAVSQATYSDDADLPYVSISPSFSSREIRNRITVTRSGGIAQVAADASSITEYGLREFSRSTLAADDSDSTDAAAWLLEKYKEPRLRFDGLAVKPRAESTVTFPAVLQREIGDRITVGRTPQNVGGAVSKEVLIEGVGVEITPEDWVTAFNLSPVDTVAPY